MKPYVVQWGLTWLDLDGPFCYPRWVYVSSEARVFTYSQAHAWAAAYGGEVVPVVSA